MPGSAWRRAGPGVGAFALVVGLALANGGYFPTAWTWTAVLVLWLTATALVLGVGVRPQRAEWALLAAFGGLLAWTALSALWSTPATALPEAERTLMYLAVAGALLLLVRRAHVEALYAGLTSALVAVSAYALATRLFPHRLGVTDAVAGARLAEPVGYWNGLGLLAALAALLALGAAAHARHAGIRAGAGAALVVVLPTLYFTFGRAAWIALAAGLAVALLADRQRTRLAATLVAVAPAPAIAVWFATRADALARTDVAVAAAAREGGRLALVIAVLALVAAGLALAAGRVGETAARAAAVLLVALAAGAVVVTLVRFDGPVGLARSAHAAFTAPPRQVEGHLSERLMSFSGNGRADLWTVAWRDWQQHRWLGSGAGTYERHWLAERPTELKVRDAHNLYLETLAELGPLGLALLLGALGIPLAAALRAGRHPLAPAALGAYVAYLVRAGADWDWELGVVTAAALTCGAMLLISARRDERPAPPRIAVTAAFSALALLGVAITGLAGTTVLAASNDAARAGRWPEAAREARRAATWAPWSAEAWRRLGDAQLAQRDRTGARVSLRRSLARDDDDWSTWLALAGAADGPAARRALARATALNPRSPEIADVRRTVFDDEKGDSP